MVGLGREGGCSNKIGRMVIIKYRKQDQLSKTIALKNTFHDKKKKIEEKLIILKTLEPIYHVKTKMNVFFPELIVLTDPIGYPRYQVDLPR